MSKNTFQPRDPKGKLLPAIDYVPLIYIAGTETHRFALHKSLNRAMPDEKKEWHVSEPTTGLHVRTVAGSYKGLPCSSVGLGQRAARDAAVATLDALLERIGSAEFNIKIAQAKHTWMRNQSPTTKE